MNKLDYDGFKKLLDKLCSENSLANALINGSQNSPAMGFLGLPEHLQKDALKRMNVKKVECPLSGAIEMFYGGDQ